jgi:hypothetical protein
MSGVFLWTNRPRGILAAGIGMVAATVLLPMQISLHPIESCVS